MCVCVCVCVYLQVKARDLGSIPGSGRCRGVGNCNPLQYSCLENSLDRGAWQATVHGVSKSQTQLNDLSARTHTHARTHAHTHKTRSRYSVSSFFLPLFSPCPSSTVLLPKRGLKDLFIPPSKCVTNIFFKWNILCFVPGGRYRALFSLGCLRWALGS